MATYFVSSSGSNTAPYDTWAKAATLLETALAAATSAGDIVVIQRDAVPSADKELAADKTWTVAAPISVVSASNDGGSAYTPGSMTDWLGNSTANRGIIVTGGHAVYFYGLRFLVSGTSTDDMVFATAAGADYTFESCKFVITNNSSGADLQFGSNSASTENYLHLIGCEFRFGHSSQGIVVGVGMLLLEACYIAMGAAVTSLFETIAAAKVRMVGCSFGFAATNLCGVMTSGSLLLVAEQSWIPSSVALPQTTYNNRSQLEVFLSDCSNGDVHYQFMYFNNLGELSVATGGSEPYITADGAAVDTVPTRVTWKIVTSSNASFANPFRTPWISRYNEALSALTPHLEALRKGSSTAFKESELWSEWSYKSGPTIPTVAVDMSDRGGAVASTTNQASSSLGAGDWTNEHASLNVYHKLAPASSITPLNVGDLSARVCVGAPSVTVYVDPQIRGL